MKKLSLLVAGVAGLVLLAVATPSVAAEHGKGKEITITGEAQCAMCALKESDKCQTVIQTVDKKGKKVTYYLTDNDAAKKFHESVCKGSKKVTATGTVTKVKGKKHLAVTKIALAK
jgi:hypothetical protein